MVQGRYCTPAEPPLPQNGFIVWGAVRSAHTPYIPRVLRFIGRERRGIRMDLQRIRNLLPAAQQAFDLDAAWRRYRGSGGLEDEAGFELWLAEQYPQVFDPRTLVDAQVEVSRVMPARFAAHG